MSWLQTLSTNKLLRAEATTFDYITDPSTLLDVYYNAQDSVYVNRRALPNTELCWRQIRGYAEGGTFKHYIDQFNLVPTTKYPTNLYQIKSGGAGTSQVAAGTAYGPVTVVPTQIYDKLGYTTPPVYFCLPDPVGELFENGSMYVSWLEAQWPIPGPDGGDTKQYPQVLPAISLPTGAFPGPSVIVDGAPLQYQIYISANNYIWRGKTPLVNTQNLPVKELTDGIVTIYKALKDGTDIHGRLYDRYLPYELEYWWWNNNQPSLIYSTRMVETEDHKIKDRVGSDDGFEYIGMETPWRRDRKFEYKQPMSYGVQWYILGQDSDKFYGPTNETDEIELMEFPKFRVKKTPAEDVIVVIAVYVFIDTSRADYDPPDSATAGAKTYIVTHGIHTISSITSSDTQLTILEAGGVAGNLGVFGYTMPQIGTSADNSYIVVDEETNGVSKIMVYALSKVHVSVPGGEFILTGSHTKTNFTTKNIVALVVGRSSTVTPTSTTTSVTAINYFAISGESMNRVAEEIHLTGYKFYLFQRSNGIYKTLEEIIGAYVQIMANDPSASDTLMVSGIKITSSLTDPMPNVSEVEYHHIQIEVVVFAPRSSAPFALSLPNANVVPPLTVDSTKSEASYDLTKLLLTVKGFISGNFTQLGNVLGFSQLNQQCAISLTNTFANSDEIIPSNDVPDLEPPIVSIEGSLIKFTWLPTSASPLPFIGKALVSMSISSILGNFSFALTIDPEPPAFAPVFVYANTRTTIDLQAQLVKQISDNIKIGANRQTADLRCSINGNTSFPPTHSSGVGFQFLLTLSPQSTLTIDENFTTATFECGDITISTAIIVEIDAFAYGPTYKLDPPLMLRAYLIKRPTPVVTWGPRTLLPLLFTSLATTKMFVDGVERVIRPTSRLVSDWIPLALDPTKPNNFVVALPSDKLILLVDFADASAPIFEVYQCQHIILPSTITIDMFKTNGIPQRLELSVNDPPIMPTVLVQNLLIETTSSQTLVVPYDPSCQISLKTVDADPNSCTIKLTIKINKLVADESTLPIYGIAPVDTTSTDITGRTTDVSVATLCPIESFEIGSASRFLGYDTRNLFIKAQREPLDFPTASDSFIFLRQSDATYKRHPFFLAIYLPPVLKWIALGQGLAIPQNPPNIPVSVNGQWIENIASGDGTLSDTAQDMTLVDAKLTATKPTNAVVVVGSLSYNLRFFTPMNPQTTLVIAKIDLEDVSVVKTVPNIKFISRDNILSLNSIMISTTSPISAMKIRIPPLQGQTFAGAYLTKFGVSQYDFPLTEPWDCIAIVDDGSPIAQTVVAIAGGSTQIRIFKTYNLKYLNSSSDLLERSYELDASRVDIPPSGNSITEINRGFIVKPQNPGMFDVAGTAYFDSSSFPNMSSGLPPFPPVDLPFAIKVVVVPSPANTATNFYNLAGTPSSIIPQLDNKLWFSMQNIGDSQVATVNEGVATYEAQPAPFYNEYIGTDTSGITTRIRLVGINIPTAYVVGETPLSTSLPISTAGSTDLFNENYAINGSTYPGKFAATLVSAPDFMSIIKSGTTWMVQFKPTQDIELTGDITFAVDQAAIKIPIEFVPEIDEAAFTVGATVNTTPKPGSYVPATFGGLSMNTSGLLTGIAAVPGTYTFWQETNISFACLRVTILEQTAILDIYCKPSAPRDAPDTRQIFPVGSDLGDLPLPFTNAIQSNVTMLSVSLDSSGLLKWHTGTAEGNFKYSIPSQDIIINFVVANPIVYDTTTVYLNSDAISATVDVESGCQQIVDGVADSSASGKPSEVFGQIACNYTSGSPLTIIGRPSATAVVKIGKSTITVKRWPTLMPIVHKTKGPFDTYSFDIVPASTALNVKAKWKFTTAADYETIQTSSVQDDGLGQDPYIISNPTGIFLRYGPKTNDYIDVIIRVEGTTPTSPDTIYAFSLIVSSADYLARVNDGDQYFVGGQVARMTPAQFDAMGAILLPQNVEGISSPHKGYYKGQLTTKNGISKLSPDAISYIEMPSSWQDVGNSSGKLYYIGGTLVSNAAGVISPTTGPIQAEARDGPFVTNRVDVETLRKVILPGQYYEGAQTVPPSHIYEGVSAVPSGFIRRSAHLLETQNAIYDFSSGLVSPKTKDPISDMIEVVVRDSSYYTHYKLAIALNVMQPKPLIITYRGAQTHVDIRDYIPYTLTNIVAYDKDSVAIAYDPTVPITGEPTIYYEGTMSSGVLIRGKIEFIKKQT